MNSRRPFDMSSRYNFDTSNMMRSEIDSLDMLYETCDAEFNSRKDIHESFSRRKGTKHWIRYSLKDEVSKVAQREEIMCSQHMAMTVAAKVAEDWVKEDARI